MDGSATISTSSGFTLVGDVAEGTNVKNSLWGRLAGASESNSTYTFNISATNEMGILIFEVAGGTTSATMSDNIKWSGYAAVSDVVNPNYVNPCDEHGLGLYAIATDGQHTITTGATGHLEWSGNPLYADNDATLLTQIKDSEIGSTSYNPANTTIDASDNYAVILAVITRGPAVDFSLGASFSLVPNAFNIYSGLVPTVDHFRFRLDDGSEIGATWEEPLDTNATMPLGDPFRLRFAIDQIVNGSGAVSFSLEYRKEGMYTATYTGRSDPAYLGSSGQHGYNVSVTASGSHMVTAQPFANTNRGTVAREPANSSDDYFQAVGTSKVQGVSQNEVLGYRGVGVNAAASRAFLTDHLTKKIENYTITDTTWSKLSIETSYATNTKCISMSGDGERLAVFEDNPGSIQIYDWTGVAWGTATETLTDFSTASQATHGELSYDGSLFVVVGSVSKSGFGNIHTFEDTGSGFTRVTTGIIEAPLVGSYGSVSILKGEYLVIGDPTYSTDKGVFHIYTWDATNTTWVLASGSIIGATAIRLAEELSLYETAEGKVRLAAGTPKYGSYGAVYHYTLDPAWITVGAQGTSVEEIIFANSLNITDGEATTQQITSGLFDAGEVAEVNPLSVSFTGDKVSELEVVALPSQPNGSEDGNVYQFRLTGTNVSNTVTPTLTIGGVSIRTVLFNEPVTLTLTPNFFNRVKPTLVSYQCYFDDGDVGDHTPKNFPNTQVQQQDDAYFHAAVLVHFDGIDAGSHTLVFQYSIDNGETWIDADTGSLTALQCGPTDYWNHNDSYTNILTYGGCDGQMSGVKVDSNKLVNTFTSVAGYCKEITNILKINSAYMEDSPTLLIGLRDGGAFDDVINLNPVNIIRLAIVPFGTATMAIEPTQPAITNLAVIFIPEPLSLQGNSLSIASTYEIRGSAISTGDYPSFSTSYYNTDMGTKRETELGTAYASESFDFMLYVEGLSDGVTEKTFEIQTSTEGGAWTRLITVADKQSTAFNGLQGSEWVWTASTRYEDTMDDVFQAKADRDGVVVPSTNSTWVGGYGGADVKIKPAPGIPLQCLRIIMQGFVWGYQTPEGTKVRIRLYDTVKAAEVPNGNSYLEVMCDYTTSIFVREDSRFDGPEYNPIRFNGQNFDGYRVVPNLDHFRGKQDYAGETDTTWIAALDTTWKQAADYPFRMRFGFRDNVYEDPQAEEHTFQLQHRIQVAGSDSWSIGTKQLDTGTSDNKYGMAITEDEVTRLVIGDPIREISGNAQVGRVLIYTKTSGSWQPDSSNQIEIINPVVEINSPRFGWSLSMVADGTTLVIGAYNCTGNGFAWAGRVYTYDLVGSSWVQRSQILEGTFTGQNFGHDVDISRDGSRLVVNAATGISYSETSTVETYKLVGNEWQVEFPPIVNNSSTTSYAGMTTNTHINKLAKIQTDPTNATEVHIYNLEEEGWEEVQAITKTITPGGVRPEEPIRFTRSGDLLVMDSSGTDLLFYEYINGAYQYRSSMTAPASYTAVCFGKHPDFLYVISNTDMYNITNSYKGMWYDIGEEGTTGTPATIYDSPNVIDGQATTQQITTSPNYNGGEITKEGICSYTSSFAVNGTEAEIVYPLIINTTGSVVPQLDDSIAFRFRNYDNLLEGPETPIDVIITVNNPAITFSLGTLSLGTFNFPTPILFFTEGLVFSGLGIEAGYAQYEPFINTAFVLAPYSFEANHGIQFITPSLSLSEKRVTTIPTTAIITQRDFRVRADDNYENLATWQGNLNANWGQPYDEPFRVRFVLENSTLSAPNQTHNYKSQYNLNNEGTFNTIGNPIERDVADSENAEFGRDVAVSGDSNVMAIAAPSYNGTYINQGRVYIYDRDGEDWIYRNYIDAPTPAANMYFGQGLAFSFTGNRIFVGEPHATGTYTEEGKVHIFTDNVGTWVYSESLSPGSTVSAGAHFGWAIDTDDSGNRLFITMPDYNYTVPDPDEIEAGAFEIWYKVSSVWAYQSGQTIGVAYAHFGTSIVSSDDGKHLAIGTPDYNDPGLVIFWDDIDGVWTMRSGAISGTNPAEQFGSSISANKTCRTMLIGAPKFSGAAAQAGRAYIIDWNGDVDNPIYDVRQAINNPDSDGGDNFGTGVAMSSSGDWCTIGTPYNDSTYTNQGAVYKLQPTYIWTTITTSTPIKFYNSSWITDGEVTTQQLSTGHFDAGTVDEADYTTVTWTTEGVSEIEYVYTVDSVQTVGTDLIKIRVIETTNSTVPEVFTNIAQLEVFTGEVDTGDLDLTATITMAVEGSVARTAIMNLNTTTVFYGNGTNEKEAIMHITSDTSMVSAGSFWIEGNLTINSTTVFYGEGTTDVEGAMHLNCTTIMNAIAYDGKIQGQMVLATTTVWSAAGNVIRNASMDLSTTTIIVLDSEVIHPASVALATTTTMASSGSLVLPASMTLATTTIMTSLGSLILPAICRMRCNTWFWGELTHVPFHYGKAIWNATTVFYGESTMTYAGSATWSADISVDMTSTVIKPGSVSMVTTTTISINGRFILGASVDMKSETIASFDGSLIHPAKAAWYTNSQLIAFGGLTKHANCAIIGETSISLLPQVIRNSNISFGVDTTLNATAEVLRTAALDLTSTCTLAQQGTISRGGSSSLLAHTYWNANGYVIPACVKTHTDIVMDDDTTSIISTSNNTDIICGE